MEHTQRIQKEFQNAKELLNNGHDLGEWVILSAVYMELVLAGILKEEKNKMANFNELDNLEAKDYIEFDEKVANVLEHACCLEKKIVEKIELGMEITEYANETNTPCRSR